MNPTVITALPKLPPRPEDSHKGTFGKVLVVAGSRGMTGAAALAARAAFRADAGYVAIAAPADSLPVLETIVLEAVPSPVARSVPATASDGTAGLGVPTFGPTTASVVSVRAPKNSWRSRRIVVFLSSTSSVT